MPKNPDEFRAYRKKMNEKILASDNLELKRFFALDSAVYREKKLDSRTKEMLGLAASTVLRCNDCILYHLIRCKEEGISDPEGRIFENPDNGSKIYFPMFRLGQKA